jgi:hypothetical protein
LRSKPPPGVKHKEILVAADVFVADEYLRHDVLAGQPAHLFQRHQVAGNVNLVEFYTPLTEERLQPAAERSTRRGVNRDFFVLFFVHGSAFWLFLPRIRPAKTVPGVEEEAGAPRKRAAAAALKKHEVKHGCSLFSLPRR